MAQRVIDHLIVGGGDAGHSCAEALREAGADGTITVVSRDPDPPYDRTACSKGYLRGEQDREATLLGGADWYAGNDVELLARTSVMNLGPAERTATLSTKETVGFGTLLLATGSNVRRLRLDGADLDGIHYLRSLRNADAIREDVAAAERVVLIGGSYIACEVAASLTELGKRCTLVMQETTTLERTFGPQAGAYFQRVLTEHGVEVRGGDEATGFEGADGRVSAVVTASGAKVPAEAVVVGAGVIPDLTLARKAGLELGDGGGVVTDAALETSIPGVFAAGDIAEYVSEPNGGERLRVEHWDVAEQHGKTVARAMLGDHGPHDVVPYFFSDLSDWTSLEYVGPARQWDEEIVRGAFDDDAFTVYYLDGGHLAAALSVGRGDDLEAARTLLGTNVSDRRDALADPDADLS